MIHNNVLVKRVHHLRHGNQALDTELEGDRCVHTYRGWEVGGGGVIICSVLIARDHNTGWRVVLFAVLAKLGQKAQSIMPSVAFSI